MGSRVACDLDPVPKFLYDVVYFFLEKDEVHTWKLIFKKKNIFIIIYIFIKKIKKYIYKEEIF
jgi:hypothetical protein